MFSSLLPNVSSSLKFGQNGPSKPSSRFSVRVFKTPVNTGFGYSVPAKPDVGYISTSQRDPQSNNWYPSSTYSTTNYEPQQRLRGVGNFSIYPSAINDTFIYEQSTCSKSDIFSTSEMDSESTVTLSPSSAFSPALYADSTVAFPSTPITDRAPDDHRIHRSPTPSPRSGYSAAPQLQSLNRTASAGHHVIHEVQTEADEDRHSRVASLQQQQTRAAPPMHAPIISPVTLVAEPTSHAPSSGGRYIPHVPEYAASTISELEVEQRDRIAQINAEYNSYTSSSSSGSSLNDADRRWITSITAPIPLRDNFTRVASSQPLHPNLHFPSTRIQEETEFNAPPPVFHLHTTASLNPSTSVPSFSHNPYPLRDGNSPPLVERISSQASDEYDTPEASRNGHGHHPFPGNGKPWSRDATFDSEQTTRGTGSYGTSPKNSPTAAPSAPTSHLQQQLNGGSLSSSHSAHATHGTSSQDVAEFGFDRRQDRPLQPAAVDVQRQQQHRRSLIVGPRPDPALSRSQSEAREHPLSSSLRDNDKSTYGGRERDREWDREQGREREGEREHKREQREQQRDRDPPQAQGSPPRDSLSRASIAVDLRRETRTPVLNREGDETPIRKSRRDSYAPESPRSSKDIRAKSQPVLEETRNTYIAGPLSASPTQIRMSPAHIETPPIQHRVPPPVYEDNGQGENVRTRSTSFSHSARPTMPAPSALHYPPLSQQPKVAHNGGPDPRQQGPDYDKHQRTGEISPSFVSEPSYVDVDRRKDIRESNAWDTHYPQLQPPTLSRYESTSQRQHMVIPPPPQQTPPRTMDRSPSKLQSIPPSHARGGSTQDRPRSSYAEPVYTHPHTESLPRHSGGDEPYKTSTSFTPHSAIPHDKPGSNNTKVTLASANIAKSTHSNHSTGSAHSEPQPQRRYSDGDQSPPSDRRARALSGRNSTPLLRSVRWTENLICPSPTPPKQRRKGWFNRRGDQLWTNDGAYKAAPPGEEYPPDLDDYPEQKDGWMNEECVRIDLNHRLIPKPPLRSALKQTNLRG